MFFHVLTLECLRQEDSVGAGRGRGRDGAGGAGECTLAFLRQRLSSQKLQKEKNIQKEEKLIYKV